MAKSRNVQRYFVPPPVGGLDFRIPTSQLPSINASLLINFHAENGRLKKRNPHTVALDYQTDSASNCIGIPYFDGTDVKPILINETKTDDGTNETNTPLNVVGTRPDWTIFEDTILVPMHNTGEAQQLNPSTLVWSSGITYTLSNSGGRHGICHYRERVYIADGDKIHYGGVGATSGAATSFNVGSLISGNLEGIETISFHHNNLADQLLVAVSDRGEVLVFQGANPGAADWSLIQQYQLAFQGDTSNALWNVEMVKMPNDLLLCTKKGYQIYSVRELLSENRATQWNQAESFKSLFLDVTSMFKTCTYWPERDKLIAFCRWTSADVPFLDAWGDDGFLEKQSGVVGALFLIDVKTGAVEIHDIHSPDLTASSSIEAQPYLIQMQAINDYVLLPVAGGAVRLFDATDTGNADDYGDTTYKAAVVFAPPSQLGYRRKAIKSMLAYSNVHTGHTFKYGVGKNFSTDAPDLTTIGTTVSDTSFKTHIISGAQIDHAPMICLTEESNYQTALEIYGLDVLYEEGGEY